MNKERINLELERLQAGGQDAILIEDGCRPLVLYRGVPTDGARLGLPGTADVVVPVPSGHPAPPIDLAGLVVGSPFLPRVAGGGNSQGIVQADGRQWQLASYHPHNNGGGRPYDPQRDGFHTYLDHILAWLFKLN